MTTAVVQEIVDDYLSLFPKEKDKLASLRQRLMGDEKFNHRKSFSGHGTGAAIVLSPDRTKLLLIHHLSLNMWIQPGGHWDPEDPSPWEVAQREAEEETNVLMAEALHVDPDRPHIPIDIDTHDIPEHRGKQEPAHKHHDFRYVFVATSEELHAKEDEVTEAVWVPIDSDDERLTYFKPIIAKMRHFKLV